MKQRKFTDTEKLWLEISKMGVSNDVPVPLTKGELMNMICASSTEDVAPVVHAHWEDVPFALSYCSACLGYYVNIDEKYDFTYCPHCGAKMDEVIK